MILWGTYATLEQAPSGRVDSTACGDKIVASFQVQNCAMVVGFRMVPFSSNGLNVPRCRPLISLLPFTIWSKRCMRQGGVPGGYVEDSNVRSDGLLDWSHSVINS